MNSRLDHTDSTPIQSHKPLVRRQVPSLSTVVSAKVGWSGHPKCGGTFQKSLREEKIAEGDPSEEQGDLPQTVVRSAALATMATAQSSRLLLSISSVEALP